MNPLLYGLIAGVAAAIMLLVVAMWTRTLPGSVRTGLIVACIGAWLSLVLLAVNYSPATISGFFWGLFFGMPPGFAFTKPVQRVLRLT